MLVIPAVDYRREQNVVQLSLARVSSTRIGCSEYILSDLVTNCNFTIDRLGRVRTVGRLHCYLWRWQAD